MNIPPWPKTIPEAKAFQGILKNKVRIVPLRKEPRFVAGLDAAFDGDQIIGTACLYRYPELTIIEEANARMMNLFPYVPGFLSFREGPVIIESMTKLSVKPDLLLIDGQGIAHPLRLGLASHIGVLLNTPAIGCAKSRLIGKYDEPALKKGSWASLFHNGEVVGAVLRTKDNVSPLFVSPGHRVNLKDSIEIVLNCVTRYRIPEPLRRADFLSKQIKRSIRNSHFGKGQKGSI